MIKYIDGDLIKLAQAGEFNVIIHGCNCWNTMGSGIAAQIRKVFPRAFTEDYKTIRGDKDKLGTITIAKYDCCDIVNAYTQFKFGQGRHADYDAIRGCMKEIQRLYTGKKIGLPFIGAGLAGGDWNIISVIIEEELADEDITVVRFKK